MAFLFFYFYLSKKIRLDVLCESSHMKYQVLLSLKNNEKIFKTVICCSRDMPLKGYIVITPQTKSVLYQCKGNNSIFIADLLQVSLGQGAPGPVERVFTFYAECHKRGGGGGGWPSGNSVHRLRRVS